MSKGFKNNVRGHFEMKTITIDSTTTTDEIRQALQLDPHVILQWPGLRAEVTLVSDDEKEWRELESSAEFRESIARARQQKEVTSIEDVRRELGI
jgi:hypothetical protein